MSSTAEQEQNALVIIYENRNERAAALYGFNKGAAWKETEHRAEVEKLRTIAKEMFSHLEEHFGMGIGGSENITRSRIGVWRKALSDLEETK